MCIHTHLISGASAVSLVPRPEDRMRLLSSSLRLFSGPPSSPLLFCTGMLGRSWEPEATLVSLGYLSSCSISMPCFLLCPGRTQPVLFLVCCFNRAERCHVQFYVAFEAPPLFAWITSRTRLCHIVDPHFENFRINYHLV